MAKRTTHSKEKKAKNQKKASKPFNTPHNDFFGQLMNRKEIAIAFFKRFLPPYILSQADFSTLRIEESKHIMLGGVKLYNDMIYSLTLVQGQKVCILLMCEHQSKPHPQMPFRLLQYNVATIADHLEQNNAHIPIIVNIVFYHGKEPWNYSTALADYYKDRELGVQYLDMAPFILVLLPASREDEVYIDKNLGFCFAAFRCTSSSDPYEELSHFMNIPVFKEYFQNLPDEDRYLMVSYLGACITRKGHSLEKLVTLTTNNTKEKEKMMESIAQEYIDKGIERGMERGIERGRQEEKLGIASYMLHQLKLGIEIVHQATGLSRQELARL
jgi:predicted transposase/invertase (TIGR01784 family)